MKIELKSIQFSDAMSEETYAFTANLYINGKKVGYCKNTGQGGCTDFYVDSDMRNKSISEMNRKAINEAEAYCNALPKTKYKNMEFPQSLESVIDDQLENWLKAKDVKKFENKMKKCVLVGSPDVNRASYSYYNFKVALSTIPTKQLQASIERIKSKLENGNVILNTNLTALGVTV